MPSIQRPPALSRGAIRFSTYLEASALELGKGARGERSRLKLLSAGARLLDGIGFQELKIEDVSAAAGLAKGTFYIYFSTKEVFLRELATAYCDFERQTLPRRPQQASRFGIARQWIAWYEQSFASNIGLMRCIVRSGETDAVMRELWQNRNAELVTAMLSDMLAGITLDAPDVELLHWSLRTVGGMLDQSLFERYGLHTSSGLQDPADSELLVELHAVLAYRAIYAHNPPDEEIGRAGALQALSRKLLG